jgi:3-phosphoshikimate 1-carboxyvinyltransferase
MRITVHPGAPVGGEARVPADKSIGHRWLFLAATARGSSEVRGLTRALDLRSTARVLAAVTPDEVGAALEVWASESLPDAEGDRSTSNEPQPRPAAVAIEGSGRRELHPSDGDLDCGNSGTTMRLVSGVLASCPFESRLVGDESLSARPMERVAEPLRAMGAAVETTDGRPPVTVHGGPLVGIRHATPVPSAQIKGAVLLAGIDADGETTVVEPAPTRDHTERALSHLGAPVRTEGLGVTVSRFAHPGFSATVPGDVSAAAFLIAAAALTGGTLRIDDVGLNPSRTYLFRVLDRMGVRVETHVDREELGEPVGSVHVEPAEGITGTTVADDELPQVIDEVPILAILAATAEGETRFSGARELRLKESDRLTASRDAIRLLGGDAAVEGDDLVVAGGGLEGGTASARGDHRFAMAIAVAGLAAASPVTVDGIEAADVSFPAFVAALSSLGARIEP